MTIENANRLAEMRRAHGLSQEELAEKLSISRQAISKWERAEASPDTDNLIALARLYGVSMDVLLGLQVPERPLAKDEAEYEAPNEAEAPNESIDPTESEFPVEPEAPTADPLPNGSFYEAREQAEAAARARRRNRFPYPVLVVIIYLVLGTLFHLWHPGWLIFLTIPLYYLPEQERTPLRLLGNPVMVTIIYLLLGIMCNLWHPGWLIFLLIPVLNCLARR